MNQSTLLSHVIDVSLSAGRRREILRHASALSNPVRLEILSALVRQGIPATVSDLARDTGNTKATTRYAVRDLVASGVLVSTPVAGPPRFAGPKCTYSISSPKIVEILNLFR